MIDVLNSLVRDYSLFTIYLIPITFGIFGILCLMQQKPISMTIIAAYRQFLEVSALQALVQVLGDVFPGGEPVVALLLPRVVVVPPARRREGPPHLQV